MEDKPLVSIALCTYNGVKFLIQQLDTLVDQTYENIEIIAVDDCSTDGTFELLQGYAERYANFFVYRNETNIGFLKNFEGALGRCHGEFIALCDQDDIWHPQKIELQMAAIGNNMVIYHDSEFIDGEGELMNKKMSDFHNFYRGDEPKVFLFWNCVSGHSMLFRKELLQYAFPFKNNFYHDWWLTYVAVNVGSIDFIPQCLVQYRRHGGSSTENDILSKPQRLLQDMRWLELCASYRHNKHPGFVTTLYELYKARVNSFTSIHLWNVLKENMDWLYFIDRRRKKTKRKQLRSYIWGLRSKNIWHTFIRPNPAKIFRY
jgi:glycosyltransferase involved in cell wall biosynthesis